MVLSREENDDQYEYFADLKPARWGWVTLILVIIVAFFIGGSAFWYTRGLERGVFSRIDRMIDQFQRHYDPTKQIKITLAHTGQSLRSEGAVATQRADLSQDIAAQLREVENSVIPTLPPLFKGIMEKARTRRLAYASAQSSTSSKQGSQTLFRGQTGTGA